MRQGLIQVLNADRVRQISGELGFATRQGVMVRRIIEITDTDIVVEIMGETLPQSYKLCDVIWWMSSVRIPPHPLGSD